MDCNNIGLGGIMMDCQPCVGGIAKVFLIPFGQVASVALDDKGEEIKSITLATPGEGEQPYKWYEYQFRRGTGSLASELTSDETTGVNYVTNNLSLVFTKMETAKRIEMAALAVAHCCAIVVDGNGKRWFLGKDDYVAASAGAGNTGTAKGDQNAYTLTLTSEEQSFPYELADDVVIVL